MIQARRLKSTNTHYGDGSYQGVEQLKPLFEGDQQGVHDEIKPYGARPAYGCCKEIGYACFIFVWVEVGHLTSPESMNHLHRRSRIVFLH